MCVVSVDRRCTLILEIEFVSEERNSLIQIIRASILSTGLKKQVIYRTKFSNIVIFVCLW